MVRHHRHHHHHHNCCVALSLLSCSIDIIIVVVAQSSNPPKKQTIIHAIPVKKSRRFGLISRVLQWAGPLHLLRTKLMTKPYSSVDTYLTRVQPLALLKAIFGPQTAPLTREWPQPYRPSGCGRRSRWDSSLQLQSSCQPDWCSPRHVDYGLTSPLVSTHKRFKLLACHQRSYTESSYSEKTTIKQHGLVAKAIKRHCARTEPYQQHTFE